MPIPPALLSPPTSPPTRTFLGLDEIGAIESALGAPGYVPNTAQRRLAEEVTKFVHGEEGLRQALQATEVCVQ